jgi:hypothetical protein
VCVFAVGPLGHIRHCWVVFIVVGLGSRPLSWIRRCRVGFAVIGLDSPLLVCRPHRHSLCWLRAAFFVMALRRRCVPESSCVWVDVHGWERWDWVLRVVIAVVVVTMLSLCRCCRCVVVVAVSLSSPCRCRHHVVVVVVTIVTVVSGV